MEQFGQEDAGIELDQRRHGGVCEGGVGLLAHLPQVRARDLAIGEGPDHPGGDLGVGRVGEARDLGGADLWPGLRHIKPAVRREPTQDRIDKAHVRGLAPGGDVTHQPLIRLKTAAP